MTAQPAPRIFSTVFGLLMVAASAAPADGPALAAAGAGAVAVVVALVMRPAVTVAVLATVTALALSEPAPLYAALSGLSAVAYLTIRHAVDAPGVVTTTRATVLAAVGFTVVGLAVAALPVQVRWLPLLAPVVVAAIYLLAIRPFLESGRWESGHHG